MVMYGIGHGGIEVWAITLLSVISLLVIAVVIRMQGMDNGLQLLGVTGDMPENVMTTVAATITAVADFGAATGVLYVFERICCMFVHISLTSPGGFGTCSDRYNACIVPARCGKYVNCRTVAVWLHGCTCGLEYGIV